MSNIKISKALKKEEKKGRDWLDKTLSEGQASKEEEKKNIILVIGVLVGILVVSMAGFKIYNHFTGAKTVSIGEIEQLNNKGESYSIKGYNFIYIDGMWRTDIKLGDRLLRVPLHFGPREASEVLIEGNLSSDFNKGDEVFMAIDPTFSNKYYSLALGELSMNVVKGLNRKVLAACTKNDTICVDREILNCENTQGKPVIELRYEGESKITMNGTCILISGTGYGIVKAADRLLWQWYGVTG